MADEALDLEGRQPASRQGRLLWPVILLLGWLLYELTAQPALAVTVVCLKFGWESFRTGWWLLRHDGQRGRAWACFFLYVSSGLWKAALTAFVLLVGYVLGMAATAPVKPAPGQVAVDLWHECLVAFLTGMGGILLAMLTTALAVAVAWLSREKLWLNGSIHDARRKDCWPPTDELGGGINRLGLLTVPLLLATWLAIIGGVGATLRAMNGPNAPLTILAVCLLACFPWVWINFMHGYLTRHVFAQSPTECWGSPPQGSLDWFEESGSCNAAL
jgi:hypothetical protein